MLSTLIRPELMPKDLVDYWSAFQSFLSNQNPYDLKILATIQGPIYPTGYGTCPFRNPPWMPILFAPLFFLPLNILFTAWRIISVLIMILASLAFFKPRSAFHALIIIALCLCNAPLWLCIVWGQYGAFLFLGSILVFIGIKKENYLISGIGLVFLSIKPLPFYLFLAVFLLHIAQSSKRIIGQVFLPWLVLFLLTLIVFPVGISGWIHNGFGSLYGQTDSVFLFWTDTASGLIAHVLQFKDPSNAMALGLCGASIPLFFMMVKKNRFSIEQTLLLSIPISLFFTPYGWIHDRLFLGITPLFFYKKASDSVFFLVVATSLVVQIIAGEVIESTKMAGAAWWYTPFYIGVVALLILKTRSPVPSIQSGKLPQ